MLTKVWTWIKSHVAIVVMGLVIIGLVAFMLLRQSGNKVASANDPSAMLEVSPGASAPAVVNPGMGAAIPAGTTTFCLRLDGRENGHLPALMGSAATNAYPNGLNGSNWSLPSSSSGAEPYGIMSDGTVFAKESFLKQYGMVSFVEIKCDRTGWIAEKMTPATIGGEAAWVFKLN